MLAPAVRLRASLGSDRIWEFNAPAGHIVVNPANVDSTLSWPHTRENAVIGLTPDSLLDLATQEFDVGAVEIQPPPFGTVDLQAFHIAQLLTAELTQRETANELYLDSLLTLFGIHLIRNYTGVHKSLPTAKGGLSNRSARMVQEYLDANFTHKISVAELAAVAGYSPHHFIQVFTKTFASSPHQYVIGLRLGFAERLLVNSDLSIAEVAELSGFSSQSHLTSVMQKYRQTTPMQIRRDR